MPLVDQKIYFEYLTIRKELINDVIWPKTIHFNEQMNHVMKYCVQICPSNRILDLNMELSDWTRHEL